MSRPVLLWGQLTAAPRNVPPVPPSWYALGYGLGWSEAVLKILWRVAAASERPRLKAMCLSHVLLIDQLPRMADETILEWIQNHADPKVLSELIEAAWKGRYLQRSRAKVLEDTILKATNAAGQWKTK